MKIWQFLDARSVGGIERHVATLVRALRARQCDAEVILWRGYEPSTFRQQLIADGVPHRTLDGSLRGFVAALARERPELLHTHGYKANIIGRLAARALAIPVVSTYHSGEQAAFPVSLYLKADIATSRFASRIAVSQEIAARLPQPVSVVRNFLMVDPGPVGPSLPRRVGFIGRLSHEKGPDLFGEIAEASSPGIEWHVWGDGPMRGELEQRFGANGVFHGLTLDVASALRSIGLLLMPSRAEGLPMAALEALAAGVPVAAARVGGMPDLIRQGENGWLFAPSDVRSAAACIGCWADLDANAQAALRRVCRATVQEGYSDAAVLPALLAIYRHAGLDTAELLPANCLPYHGAVSGECSVS